jgi:GMP synthase (glutamine-hydrolysing)
MKVLVIDSTRRGDEAFNQPLLKGLSGLAEVTVKKLAEIKSTKDARGHDAMIIAGVPIDYPYKLAIAVHKPIKYGVKLGMPMLGICLGHEGIGTFFGSKLITAREKVDGTHKINTEPSDPIFQGLPGSFSSRQIHEASITLPNQFKLIASSNKCYNMGMKHRSKPIYGLQFHPEFRPARLKIFHNFVKIASEYGRQTKPDRHPVAEAALARV